MQEAKRATKQIAVYNVLRIVDFVAAFAVLVVLTRYLSESDFGLYSLINVTISIGGGLFAFGVSEYILRALAGMPKGKRVEEFGVLYRFLLCYVAVLALVLGMLSYLILDWMGHSHLFGISVFGIVVICLGIVMQAVQSYLRSQKKVVRAKVLETIFWNGWGIVAVLAVLAITASVNMVFLSRAVYSGLVFIGLIAAYAAYLKGDLNRSIIQKAIIFGLPLSTIVISRWLITGADRYIIGFFHSTVEVANYSYIYTLLGMVGVFAGSIGLTLGPYFFSEHNKKNVQRSQMYLNAMLKYQLIILVPGVIGFFVMGEEIVSMISGEKYLSALAIVPFLMLFPVLDLSKDVFANKIMSKDQTLRVAGLYGVGILINVLLNLLLVPQFVALGAAIATSFTYLILLVLFYLPIRKEFPIQKKYLKLGRIIACSVIMGVILFFIDAQTIITKIATIILGVVIYGSAIILLGVLEGKELIILKSLFKK